MRIFTLVRRHLITFSILAMVLTGSCLAQALAPARSPVSQVKPPGSSNVTAHDSVDVVANLSPEEIEDGKLNDVYQPIAEQQRKADCTAATIEQYRSKVIPLAEKSVFNVPKNKFLFLANRDIGNCYLNSQNFVEAEAAFKKIL